MKELGYGKQRDGPTEVSSLVILFMRVPSIQIKRGQILGMERLSRDHWKVILSIPSMTRRAGRLAGQGEFMAIEPKDLE
jgi:hypothetical protein